MQAVQATRDFKEGKFLVFATRKGQIKKTEFGAYNTPIKADGIIAIKVRDDDELLASGLAEADPELHARIVEARSELIRRFEHRLPPFANPSVMTPSRVRHQQNVHAL